MADTCRLRASGAFLACGDAHKAWLNVCLAPAIDPGRIRLVRHADPPAYGVVVASLEPSSAVDLGRALINAAEHLVKQEPK